MSSRLPAHLVAGALIRAVEAQGGFGTVISRGERDAGVILILTNERGRNARLWERMPQADGSRPYVCTRGEDVEKPEQFGEYISRRIAQDPDSWVIELDIVNPKRFIETMVT